MNDIGFDVWHIGIPVKNLEDSLRFYAHGLGFEFLGRYKDTMGFVRPPGKSFTLEFMEMTENESGFGSKPHHLAFACDDLEAFRADLLARGVAVPEIVASHSGLKLFELKDPDGIRVQFFSGRAGFDASIAQTKETIGALS